MENEIKNIRLVQIRTKKYCDFIENVPSEELDTSKQIYITDEDRLEIGITKCFDLENNCIIDYDNSTDKIIELKDDLRTKRKLICFPIINRGQLWYDNLTKVQKEELRTWYIEWLDVTETMEEPKVPDFLSKELEKFYIFREEQIEKEITENLYEETEKENELFEIEEDIENIRDALDEEMLLEEEF